MLPVAPSFCLRLDAPGDPGVACRPWLIDSNRPMAASSQLACYAEWLKVDLNLRYALSCPWASAAWQEARQQIPCLLAERPTCGTRDGSTRGHPGTEPERRPWRAGPRKADQGCMMSVLFLAIGVEVAS